ncbi:MAG TPA: hypothetical protein PLI73_01705, partial [Candidatus Cloacimonadota bacterium]|nr:hypothetical protein [Candidatus Cloacimonadota bacterium]
FWDGHPHCVSALVCCSHLSFLGLNKEDKREREERGEWKECKPMPVSGMVIRTAFLLLFAALICSAFISFL